MYPATEYYYCFVHKYRVVYKNVGNKEIFWNNTLHKRILYLLQKKVEIVAVSTRV